MMSFKHMDFRLLGAIAVIAACSVSVSTPLGAQIFGTSFESVAITGFSASPPTITEGQSTTLSWTTLRATTCTATDGAGDWSQTTIELPNGSVEVTIDTPGTYEFTLTCQDGAGDSTVEHTTVVVNAEVDVCGTPALSLSTVMLWETFWGVAFPGPASDNEDRTVPRSGYAATKFNTGEAVDDGQLTLWEWTGTTGLRRGTISECPGDFNIDFDNDPTNCSDEWGLGGGIRWATNGRSGACQLKANTDYYFNVTFTDGVDDTTSTCETNNARNLCRVTVKHTNP